MLNINFNLYIHYLSTQWRLILLIIARIEYTVSNYDDLLTFEQ